MAFLSIKPSKFEKMGFYLLIVYYILIKNASASVSETLELASVCGTRNWLRSC